MTAQQNAELIRRVLDAMNAGDTETVSDSLADDIVWHYIGGSEPIRGKAALAQMISPDRGWSVEAKIHDVLATDDHAVALVEATATKGGATLQYRTAEICHISDGRITERWAFSDDTAEIVAFFA